MLNLETLKKECYKTGIGTDFDGTISAIQTKPASAVIEPRAKELLAQLKQTYQVVSVISGRPVKQLAKLVGIKDLAYVGNHGAEFLSGNNYIVEREAEKTAPLLKQIYQQLSLGQKEFVLDYKKYSLSIHYRTHPKPEKAEKKLKNLLKQYAGPSLRIQKGRKVFDLFAKNVSKGSAIERLINKYELKYFLYVGDDRTDIDAFDKMTELNQEGIYTLKIALDSHEAPKDLLKKSDIRISSLKELLDLFRALL